MIDEPARAKINIALHVTGKRSDGYHLLETMVVFAELADRVTVEPAEKDSFTISGPFSEALTEAGGNSDNLVVQARERLRKSSARFGMETPPVAIHLEKNLPVASGIGGGSADAAATLRALSKLWKVEIDRHLAASLGADVPMCVAGQPLIARGIGDELQLVADFPHFDILLVNPMRSVATPAVFGALASPDNDPLNPMPATADPQTLLAWLQSQRNDLTDAAIEVAPEIKDVLTVLGQLDADLVRMSGSGATCFCLFQNPDACRDAGTRLSNLKPDWYSAISRTLPSFP